MGWSSSLLSPDLVVVGPSPSVSKKSLLRKSRGADVAEKLAEKKRQTKVRFASKHLSNDDDDVPSGPRGAAGSSSSSKNGLSGERANDAMKKQFKKMKKERKRNDKVASGLADGLNKAFSSLGGGGKASTRKIGEDDDYDFGVL